MYPFLCVCVFPFFCVSFIPAERWLTVTGTKLQLRLWLPAFQTDDVLVIAHSEMCMLGKHFSMLVFGPIYFIPKGRGADSCVNLKTSTPAVVRRRLLLLVSWVSEYVCVYVCRGGCAYFTLVTLHMVILVHRYHSDGFLWALQVQAESDLHSCSRFAEEAILRLNAAINYCCWIQNNQINQTCICDMQEKGKSCRNPTKSVSGSRKNETVTSVYLTIPLKVMID